MLQPSWLNRSLLHSGNFPQRTIGNSGPLNLKPYYAHGNKCSGFSLDQCFSAGVLQKSGVSPEVVQMCCEMDAPFCANWIEEHW